MLDILAITGPIYITIALGFATTRLDLFSKSDMRVLGKFVVNLALPALLFNALAQRSLGEIINGRYLLVYAAGSLLALGLGWLWARRVAGVMLGLNMIVENLLLIPLLLALAERGDGHGGAWHRALRLSLGNLLRNPMVLGLLAGLLVSLLGWQLPSPVARTVTLFSQASGALSLFVIGGALVGLQIQGLRRQVAQIVAAMPMLGIYPILAQKHGREGLAAAALLGATVVSFVSISVLLWVFQQVPGWGR